MKTIVRLILAVVSLVTAMTISSCRKEDITTHTVNVTERNRRSETGKPLTYTLSIAETPASLGEGQDTTIVIKLETNIPETDLRLSAENWMEATLKDGRIKAKIARNEVQDDREGILSVSDVKGRVASVSCPLRQGYILVNREGTVPFKDKAFKKAMLSVADTDNDGDISKEEAEAVETIDISGLGIKDLTGLDWFKNITRFNAKDNTIVSADFSDPGSYTNLRYIDLRNNPNLQYPINVSGTYSGKGAEFLGDKHDLECNYTTYYESTDFSYNGIKEVYTHTIGKGIVLNLMINSFLDVDYRSGAVDDFIENEIKTMFLIEPFSSMKQYFDVRIWCVVAPSTEQKGDVTSLTAQYEKETIENYLEQEDDKLPPYEIFIHYYENGYRSNATSPAMMFGYIHIGGRKSFSMVSGYGIDTSVIHEMGHAIGNLADQYEERNKQPSEAINFTRSDTLPALWTRLIESNEKYKNRIGWYAHNNGHYASEHSIMSDDSLFFDTPSRYSIFMNILQLSGEDKNKDIFEEFIEYDVVNDDLPY